MGIQGQTRIWKNIYHERARYAETLMDIIQQYIKLST